MSRVLRYFSKAEFDSATLRIGTFNAMAEKAWLTIKSPKAPAATRAADGTF